MASDPKACYFEYGNLAKDHVPCDPNAAVSACCWPGSVCVENLYCRDNKGNTLAGTCTDQYWGINLEPTPQCPCRRFVKSENTTQNYRDSTTFCPDGSICCGINNFGCCDAGDGSPRIAYGNQQTIPAYTAFSTALSAYYAGVKATTLPVSSRTGSATTTRSGATVTVTRGSNAATGDIESGGLSSAAKIGIGVGVSISAVFMIVAIALMVVFWKRFKRLNAYESLAVRDDSRGQRQTTKGAVQPRGELPTESNTWDYKQKPIELASHQKSAI